MKYTKEQIISIIRGEKKKSFTQEMQDFMYLKRLSFLWLPSVYYSSARSMNNRYRKFLLYWIKKMKRRKNLKNYQRLYNRYKKNRTYNTVLKHNYHVLTFKAFYSNFFIMLTDKKGNPLISCSTGQVANSRSKKKKNSLTLIHPMMRKIKLVLLKNRITNIAIHIKTDISAKVISAIKFLKNSKYKFKFPYIALVKPIPHHFGRRKRKPRRV